VSPRGLALGTIPSNYRKVTPMMFYNGFNLMIDILLVTSTAFYIRWRVMRDHKLIDMHTLDYEYNEGYNAGYEYALKVTKEVI